MVGRPCGEAALQWTMAPWNPDLSPTRSATSMAAPPFSTRCWSRSPTMPATARTALVFLGDYIDRGPDSAAVLRTVSRLNWAEPDRVTCLMGNHERMLLDALLAPQAAEHWLYNGGDATLDSFGARDVGGLPRDTLDWLEALPTLHGGCGAVVRPCRLPARQRESGSGRSQPPLDPRAVPGGGPRFRPPRGPRPHAAAERTPRDPPVPHQSRHRRGLWRRAHGGGVLGRAGTGAGVPAGPAG